MCKEQIDTRVLLDFCDRFQELSVSEEPSSIYLCNTLDFEFHKYIISCSNNTRLIDFFTSMIEDAYRISIYNALSMKSNSAENTYKEHYSITQAIIVGDSDLIRKRYLEHLSQSQLASIEAARLSI